ncbi:hypothetical protein HAX54_053175, partial [Datura stramonium]|nr:hypothetical protein [Datura stramonium]
MNQIVVKQESTREKKSDFDKPPKRRMKLFEKYLKLRKTDVRDIKSCVDLRVRSLCVHGRAMPMSNTCQATKQRDYVRYGHVTPRIARWGRAHWRVSAIVIVSLQDDRGRHCTMPMVICKDHCRRYRSLFELLSQIQRSVQDFLQRPHASNMNRNEV